MRTARCSGRQGDVSQHALGRGVCLLRGVSARCMLGYVPPPPWTEWPTLVKTLPCCNYFADGKKQWKSFISWLVFLALICNFCNASDWLKGGNSVMRQPIRNCLFLFPTILAPSDKHETMMNTYSHPLMNKQNKRNLESCNQSVCLHCLLTGYFFSALKYLCTKFCIWTFPLWC